MSQFLIFYGLRQAWYRPDAKGYTDSVMEAGRFTQEEANRHAERGDCFVVEDGSEEMQKLCNKWERYFLPILAITERERDEAMEALRPFAGLDVSPFKDSKDDRTFYQINETEITIGNLRRAHAVLAKIEGGQG